MSTQLLTAQASPELSVWAELLRGQRGLTRELSASLLEEHGLTINAFEVLLLLDSAEEKQMRRVDLAEAVILTPSGITRLLDGLEKAGYVEKRACASDARVSYAALTEPGREKLAEAAESHFQAIRGRLAETFTAEELATLRELLGRLPGASLSCEGLAADAAPGETAP